MWEEDKVFIPTNSLPDVRERCKSGQVEASSLQSSGRESAVMLRRTSRVPVRRCLVRGDSGDREV